MEEIQRGRGVFCFTTSDLERTGLLSSRLRWSLQAPRSVCACFNFWFSTMLFTKALMPIKATTAPGMVVVPKSPVATKTGLTAAHPAPLIRAERILFSISSAEQTTPDWVFSVDGFSVIFFICPTLLYVSAYYSRSPVGWQKPRFFVYERR